MRKQIKTTALNTLMGFAFVGTLVGISGFLETYL